LGYASHLAAKAIDESASSVDISNASFGLVIYYVHLGLNLAWSPIFFKAKHTGLAFANTAFMTVTALYMTKLLHRPTNHEATFCLLPYCAWMGYLTYLNGGIWWLNIGRRGPKKDDDDED
jgi:benzodiazapine receptor